MFHSPDGLRSSSYGRSHGLKSVPRTLFAPVYALTGGQDLFPELIKILSMFGANKVVSIGKFCFFKESLGMGSACAAIQKLGNNLVFPHMKLS